MFTVIMIILFSIAIFTYLIIVGGNMNKSDEDREKENQEEIEYFKRLKEEEKNEYK